MKLIASFLLLALCLSSKGQAKEEILKRVRDVQVSIESKNAATQIKLDSLGMDIGSFSKRWLSNRNADVLIHYYQSSVEYWAYLNTNFPASPLPISDLTPFIGNSLPREDTGVSNYEITKPKAEGVRSSVDNLLQNTANIAQTSWRLDSAKTKYFENISENLVLVQNQLAQFNENIGKVLAYNYSIDSLENLEKLKKYELLQKSSYLMLIHKFQKP